MKKPPVKIYLILAIISASFILTSCKKNKCVENRDGTCICPAVYDPVCGCNDKTYGNSCDAECAGITEYKKGACQ